MPESHNARVPHNVEVPTDAGKVTITVVGGPHPYVWIGQDGDYLDSIDLALLTKAAKPRKARRRAS